MRNSQKIQQAKKNMEEYFERLNKSAEDISNGKGVTFTMQELEEFINK